MKTCMAARGALAARRQPWPLPAGCCRSRPLRVCTAAAQPPAVPSGASKPDPGSIINTGNTQAGAEHCTHSCLPPAQLRWEALTRHLVRGATLAVLADAAVRAAAQAAAGSLLQESGVWVPLASNLTSYLILSSTFVSDGERETSACYLAGLVCTFGLMAQAYHQQAVPTSVFWPALLLTAGSVAVNGAKLAGLLELSGLQSSTWVLWRSVVCYVGWAMLPQVAYLSLAVPAAAATGASWGPAAVSLAVGAALLALIGTGRVPPSWRGTWDVASWTATLLFMLEPVAALAAVAREPGTLVTASPTDFLLPALVTGLQVPRALLRDHMWFTGTTWATIFACWQAALVAAAHCQLGVAAIAAVAPLLCAACMLHGTAKAHGYGTPLHPLRLVIAGYLREAQPWRELGSSLKWRQRAVALVRKLAVGHSTQASPPSL